MNKKIFVLELITGIFGLVLVALFGIKGLAAIALFAFSPLCRNKIKEISNENKMLFYKINNITFIVSFIVLVILFFIKDYTLSFCKELLINNIWLFLFVFIFILSHGITGLFMSKDMQE